jgi:hypothetical protein
MGLAKAADRTCLCHERYGVRCSIVREEASYPSRCMPGSQDAQDKHLSFALSLHQEQTFDPSAWCVCASELFCLLAPLAEALPRAQYPVLL